jgi:hypothetical protein
VFRGMCDAANLNRAEIVRIRAQEGEGLDQRGSEC